MEIASSSRLLAELLDHQTHQRALESAIWQYALAHIYYREGNREASSRLASECLEAVSLLPDKELEDVTHTFITIAGIHIPEYFHSVTVRSRFESAGIIPRAE